jgi:putative integral membrane protein (TIGR02587 family)
MPHSAGAPPRSQQEIDRVFAIGLARAFGGAVFFSLPLLMTMEMWWLGFYMDRFRLALFMALFLPLLIGLDYYSGFRETSSWREDIVDGLVGYGVGFVAAGAILLLLGIIDIGTAPREAIGKISIQAVPASFGAVLAASQLSSGGEAGEDRKESVEAAGGYRTELLFMTAGAVFLAFNVAPTEEMLLIASRMSPWNAVALALASLAMMHAFVYAVEFRGSHSAPEGTPWWSIFLRFTVVGYALALAVSAYVLWTFGRIEDAVSVLHLQMVIVLGLPASLGASAARLIL